MKIKIGIYTIYKNIEMQIVSYYGHGISDPEIENYRRISYDGRLGYLEGFEIDKTTNICYKDIHINELKNAYRISIKASYKGVIMNVYNFFDQENLLGLTTYLNIDDLNFIESLDDFGKKYYKGTVQLSDIEEIWEERTRSEFDLSMPKGMEVKKVIKLPSC